MKNVRLCSEDTSTTDSPDLRLSMSREELGADDDRLLRKTTLAENLEVTSTSDVDHRDRTAFLPILADILGNKSPELVQIDAWAEVL